MVQRACRRFEKTESGVRRNDRRGKSRGRKKRPTAYDRYSIFVGEIGLNRREYLYQLRYIDLLMIQRGHDRRHRQLWSAARWQTYHLMAAFAGSKALSEAGINSAKDLIKFPWDTDRLPISFDDVQTIVAEIEAVKAHRATPLQESSPVQQKSSEH